MGLPDHHAVVAAAAAAQISLFPGMDLSAFRAAAHASGHPPFVPPPHFMAAMSQDPSLFGGIAFDGSQPGKTFDYLSNCFITFFLQKKASQLSPYIIL